LFSSGIYCRYAVIITGSNLHMLHNTILIICRLQSCNQYLHPQIQARHSFSKMRTRGKGFVVTFQLALCHPPPPPSISVAGKYSNFYDQSTRWLIHVLDCYMDGGRRGLAFTRIKSERAWYGKGEICVFTGLKWLARTYR
jgi:hypothetical protein